LRRRSIPLWHDRRVFWHFAPVPALADYNAASATEPTPDVAAARAQNPKIVQTFGR
jgi:hypothetical protein